MLQQVVYIGDTLSHFIKDSHYQTIQTLIYTAPIEIINTTHSRVCETYINELSDVNIV